MDQSKINEDNKRQLKIVLLFNKLSFAVIANNITMVIAKITWSEISK